MILTKNVVKNQNIFFLCVFRPQPSYNQGLYGGYGNYNSMYGGMMNTLPAKDPRSQPVAAKSVEAEVRANGMYCFEK